MWGTPFCTNPPQLSTRFTPTHVGNTMGLITAADRCSVHPHACGEHRAACLAAAAGVGSPPRMWGTLTKRDPPVPGGRFTPTHVGNTHRHDIRTYVMSVHPHACGEHQGHVRPMLHSVGSPPRMWGTQPRQPDVLRWKRFTPTHVGNTNPL